MFLKYALVCQSHPFIELFLNDSEPDCGSET